MPARILVVDDLPASVKVLEAKLTSEYYEVLTATDGATALEIVRERDPDLVLLDVLMPGMDGVQVAVAGRAGEARHRRSAGVEGEGKKGGVYDQRAG